MNRFRCSYSMLSAWQSGDFDRAIKMYLRKEVEATEKMEAGKKFHLEFEAEAKTTAKLPKIFGELKFLNPEFELKKEKDIGDWIQLVGILDVKDGELGIDYKTGVTESSLYAKGNQHKVYQILWPDLKRFEYYHYNQYNNKVDMSIVYLNDQTLEEGIEWVVSNASEMKNYIDNNELIVN